jgi:hypothetical protein
MSKFIDPIEMTRRDFSCVIGSGYHMESIDQWDT